jgi:class 3 adenylate cyclase
MGIDTSALFGASTGMRGNNDLVWVGNAANVAAKLAAKSSNYATYITSRVYDMLNEDSKLGGEDKRNMWTDLGYQADYGVRVYGSSWWWTV